MIKGGKKIERHLCDGCARQQGVVIAAAPTGVPLTQFLSEIMASNVNAPKNLSSGAENPGKPEESEKGGAGGGQDAAGVSGEATGKVINVCPACGLGFATFRNNGLLGCPDCYAAFEGQLAPLLARAHEGGTHHSGKAPARLRGNQDPTATGARAGAAGTAGKNEALTRAGGEKESPDTKALAALVKRKLKAAVEAEQYELAAKLRDELARLEGRQ